MISPVVSAKTITGEPRDLSKSRWSRMAAISALESRLSSCALYQPEMSESPCVSNSGRSLSALRGNLRPSSTPVNPACRISARHWSSGMKSPSQCMQSLVQPMGLMPSFTVMSVLLANGAYRCDQAGLLGIPGPPEIGGQIHRPSMLGREIRHDIRVVGQVPDDPAVI